MRALWVAPLLQVPKGTSVLASVLMHVRQCIHMRTMKPHTIYCIYAHNSNHFQNCSPRCSKQFQTSFKQFPKQSQQNVQTRSKHAHRISKQFKHMSTHFKHQSQIVHTNSTLVSGTCSTYCQPTFTAISTLFLNHV